MSIWRSGLMVVGLSLSSLGLTHNNAEYDLIYNELYHLAEATEEATLLDLIDEIDEFYDSAYLDGDFSIEEQETLENYLIELKLAQADLDDEFDEEVFEEYIDFLEELFD